MRSAYNISGQYVEDLDQVAEGLLRGYVVYEVDHDPEYQEVYVSIVTTPKTLSAIANVSGSVIRCASIDHGIDYVLRQVSYGVVPPVGGKVLTSQVRSRFQDHITLVLLLLQPSIESDQY